MVAASAKPAFVRMNDGMWKFNDSGTGATVGGRAVAPGALRVLMNCVLIGQTTPTGNLITSLAC
jgi:hypothetical protein